MPLVQLIVLAIIQGITEFLPISSSAHLILVPLFADGWADQGPLIDAAAHLGTLAAVLLYFRRETAMLFRGGLDAVRVRDTADRRLFLMLAAATIPVCSFAGALVLTDNTSLFRSPTIIGCTMIFWGVLLWHADRRATSKVEIDKIGWRDAMTIGAMQALSVIPGTSRSGITMTTSRYLGWSRTEASRFSMLLAIPSTAAFGLFAVIELAREGSAENISAGAIVAVLSFFVAYATIALLMRYIQKISFTPFAIYRVLLGAFLLAFGGALAGGR